MLAVAVAWASMGPWGWCPGHLMHICMYVCLNVQRGVRWLDCVAQPRHGNAMISYEKLLMRLGLGARTLFARHRHAGLRSLLRRAQQAVGEPAGMHAAWGVLFRYAGRRRMHAAGRVVMPSQEQEPCSVMW